MKRNKAKNIHHYVESGLDYIFLMNGFEKAYHPEVGEAVSIHDVEGLNHAIANIVTTKVPRIRGQEVRFLRSELKLTQTQMGLLVGHNLRTIQRWEESRDEPIPEMADKFLRLFCAAHLDGKEIVRKVCHMLKDAQANLEKKEEEALSRIELLETGKGWKAA